MWPLSNKIIEMSETPTRMLTCRCSKAYFGRSILAASVGVPGWWRRNTRCENRDSGRFSPA